MKTKLFISAGVIALTAALPLPIDATAAPLRLDLLAENADNLVVTVSERGDISRHRAGSVRRTTKAFGSPERGVSHRRGEFYPRGSRFYSRERAAYGKLGRKTIRRHTDFSRRSDRDFFDSKRDIYPRGYNGRYRDVLDSVRLRDKRIRRNTGSYPNARGGYYDRPRGSKVRRNGHGYARPQVIVNYPGIENHDAAYGETRVKIYDGVGTNPNRQVARPFIYEFATAGKAKLYSNEHVRWCDSLYLSYRTVDNTYQTDIGGREQCESPYR